MSSLKIMYVTIEILKWEGLPVQVYRHIDLTREEVDIDTMKSPLHG